MFKFALRNMRVKRAQMLLVCLSIILSAGIAVLAYNTAMQVDEGITSNAAYYSVIIGPSGSGTQLAMNTMYFTESPLGTLPYSAVGRLQADARVRAAVPFAMADSYNGSSIVGTVPAFLDGKTVDDGRLMDESGALEAVVGARVAKENKLSVGDLLYTSHSAGETHKTPLKVVGILSETHSVYDTVIFTQLESIWQLHEEEEAGEKELSGVTGGEEAGTQPAGMQNEPGAHRNPADDAGKKHEDHEEMDGMVCAILVKTTTPATAIQLVNEYDGLVLTEDGKNYPLQAVEPMETVRAVLDDADTTKYIVFILCGIILIMNILIIVIITLLNMMHAEKEIALLRLIGVGMPHINLIYLIQNGLCGLVSCLLAFGLSRLCLWLMGDYVASFGVIISVGRVYPLEIAVLLAVLVISILPTAICTRVMSGKDGVGN